MNCASRSLIPSVTPSPITRLPDSLFEQTVDVLVGVERHEVVYRFADADVADRQLQIVRDGDGHTAFGGAVEFRQHDAVDAGGRHELARLRDAVLPDGGGAE